MRAGDFQGAIFDQDGLLFDTESVFQSSWVAAGRNQKGQSLLT